MTVRFLPDARRETGGAARYNNRQRRGLGADFRAEVKATVERFRSMPESCQAIRGEFRRCLVKRFPYAVVYRLLDDLAIVLAVAHLRRMAGYWSDRNDEPS